MNTFEEPPSTPTWVIVGRVISSSCCALVLAVTIPNLGTVPLPNHKIGYGWRDMLAIVIFVTPLIVILAGAFYSRIVEYVGWALAVGLFVWTIVAYQRMMTA